MRNSRACRHDINSAGTHQGFETKAVVVEYFTFQEPRYGLNARMRVRCDDPDHVVSNLPIAAEQADGTRQFEHSAETLPAGHEIEVRLGALPIPFEAYGRWGAAGLLGLLIMGVLVKGRRRKQVSIAEANGVRPANVQPPHSVAKRRRHRRRTTSSGPSR